MRDLVQSNAQTMDFVALCVALGASTVDRLSPEESALVESANESASDPGKYREQILAGGDPLGDRIIAMRSAADRRGIGQVFTPQRLVDEMVDWVARQSPARVVDCGCGSGRFALTAARHARHARVVAVDKDPLSTLACRANVAVLGLTEVVDVRNEDFVRMSLESQEGRTAFIGNPPYVRHHGIPQDLKQWARTQADALGWDRWSGLAGLHALFFMAVVGKSSVGDVGCLLTSSEWLEVNYGRAIRDALLNGAGGRSIHVLHPQARAFTDAMVTASILCFERGLRTEGIRLQSARRLSDLKDLGEKGRLVSRSRLEAAHSWTELIAPPKSTPKGLVPLGDYVRVSRGAVTGANDLFLLSPKSVVQLGLSEHCVPAVTRAREVISSGGILGPDAVERHLLMADAMTVESHPKLVAYLQSDKGQLARQGWVCKSRNPWYAVPLKQPPIIATYMGRGRPAYALNPDRMPIVNVVHGLYPKVHLDSEQLRGLVNYLNAGEQHGSNGRTYQGGLQKYEPGEMERLLVPPPDMLRGWASCES